MNNKNVFSLLLLILFLTQFYSVSLKAQIEAVECYTSTGAAVRPGGTWYETYNGVQYECTCRKNGGPDCVPVGSKSSGSSSNNSSGSFETQMVQSIVAPVIENFFNWLFSPSSDDNSSSNNNDNYSSTTFSYKPTEEELQKYKEDHEKWMKQVQNFKDQYTQIYNEKFSDQQKNTAEDFKNRYVKSEAVKNIKQLNCAAIQSISAYELVKQDLNNFKELETPLENSRVLSDFTNQKTSDCPEIKYEIPDVTVSNPKGFQQAFYEKIKLKADSLTLNTVQLKEKEKNIKQVVEEKKQVVDKIKLEPPKKNNNDKLMQEALDALSDALEEEKIVNNEISTNNKNIEILENIRSTYDIDEPKK